MQAQTIKKNINKAKKLLEIKGHKIPHSLLLECFSVINGYKDWNTFIAKNNNINKENIPKENHNIRFLSIDTDLNHNKLKSLIKFNFKKANACFDLIHSFEDNGKHIFKLNTKNSNNFITAIILISKDKFSKNIKAFHVIRDIIEIEDLSVFFAKK